METVNNSYKQQILHDVQMDTQTTFMNNGDINIFPCLWEQDKAPVTAEGKSLVRYRAGVMVEEDGRTRMKRYHDGLNGPKYETLFQTAHADVKRTREMNHGQRGCSRDEPRTARMFEGGVQISPPLSTLVDEEPLLSGVRGDHGLF